MLRLVHLLAAALALLATPASAQRPGPDHDRWILLGTQTVGFGVDRDIVAVGRADGAFRSLRLDVERNDIHLLSLRIVYQNGYAEEIKVDRLIKAGSRMTPIDLRGDRSFLKEIHLVYRARPNFRGQAAVKVLGEGVPVRPPVIDDWVLLGERTVGFKIDRDVVPVSRSDGWIKALRFEAGRNDIHLLSVRLVYQNGTSEELRVDRLLRASRPEIVNLQGERSFLKEIQLVYRARPGFQGQAVLRIYGEPARRGPGNPTELLGRHRVGFLGDRDVIHVGRHEGRFRSINLIVSGNDIEVDDLRVVYANGEVDDLPVRRKIRKGEQTGPLDLKGRTATIERIEMRYKSRLSLKGEAVVEVYGNR